MTEEKFISYRNHFLVSSPNMRDPIFNRSVIYLCDHTPKGAMGVVINHNLDLSLASLLERIDIKTENEALEFVCIYDGGPVHVNRGFVLHAPQILFKSSFAVTERIALTTSPDALQSIADKDIKIEKSLVTLGCCGWDPGQLESEMREGGWFIVPFSEAIMFDMSPEERYASALALLGLTEEDFGHFSKGRGGHA